MSDFEKIDFSAPAKKNLILIPQELDTLTYSGPLYGYIRHDTGIYVILGWEGNEPDAALKADYIGRVFSTLKGKHGLEGYLRDIYQSATRRGEFLEGVNIGVVGIQNAKGLEFGLHAGLELSTIFEKQVYSITQDLFSRNSGLLETNKMKDKSALIVGCGSVGSTLALQLARSGVGKFVLVDMDTVEIHNICRHQCNLTDVGRYKTDALRDRIIAINPFASVKCYNKIIQNVTDGELNNCLDHQSIIIGCGDNVVSDAYSCGLAYDRNIPFVSIGFWTRASVCEIFVSIPQRGDTCYQCAFKGVIEKAIEETRRSHHYVDDEGKTQMIFVPGLSVDIEFGTSIGSKIVLDSLNLNDPDYISKVLHTLTQWTLICNTNDTRIGGPRAASFPHPLDVVRNFDVVKDICCCQKRC